MDSRYYRQPPQEYWQGDILEVAPGLLAQTFEQEVLRGTTGRGGVQMYQRFPTDGPPPPNGFQFPETVAARGARHFAILLNHDCDFDKDPDFPKQVAVVRRFEGSPPEEVVQGRQFRTFYLPGTTDPDFGPCYADFRAITTISYDTLRSAVRVLSLSETCRLALRAQIALFFARSQQRP